VTFQVSEREELTSGKEAGIILMKGRGIMSVLVMLREYGVSEHWGKFCLGALFVSSAVEMF
jgi:hypothetical protein